MKRFLFMVVAAVGICGCSRDHINDSSGTVAYDPTKVITITTDPITRGTPITAVDGMTDMGVFCAATGSSDWTTSAPLNKMFNSKLTRNGTTWTYQSGSEILWDATTANDRYSFFAYAPYATAENGIVVTGSSASTGPPTLSYTVPTDVTNQPDLMVSVAKLNLRPYGKVPLQMEHTLTKLTFEAQLGSGYASSAIGKAGLTCKVKSITLNEAYNSSNYKIKSTEGIDAVSGATWIFDDAQKAPQISASIANGGLVNSNLTTTMTPISTANGEWFMIPQKISNRTDGLVPTLSVAFEISDGSTRVIDYDLTKAGINAWTMRQAIKYTITYNGDGSIPSAIMGTVTNWANQAIDVNLPATYLNLSQSGEIFLKFPNSLNIYYTSDASSVTATCDKGITLTEGSGYFTFPGSAVESTYTVTFTAGRIIKKVKINNYTPGGSADVLYFASDGTLQCGRLNPSYQTVTSGGTSTSAEPFTFARQDMAFFKFGSVVGFTNNNDLWADTHVKFNPVTPGGGYAYASIPVYADEGGTTAPYGGEGFISSSAYHYYTNVRTNGKGDPCKLVGKTAAQINAMTKAEFDNYNSGWRLPTSEEQADYCGLSGATAGESFNNGSSETGGTNQYPHYGSSSGIFTTAAGSDVSPARGYFPIGGGTKATENTGRYFNSTAPYLPAAGRRNTTGTTNFVGASGYYWSGTVYSATSGYYLYFFNSSVSPRNYSSYASGFGIRCVRQ